MTIDRKKTTNGDMYGKSNELKHIHKYLNNKIQIHNKQQ